MSAGAFPVGAIVAQLGECPVWSERDRRLLWCDIEGRAIHALDPSTERTESRTLPGRPGSFVLTAEPDRLLVAMEHELVELSWSTGAVAPVTQLEEPDSGKRLNDGRCDRAGRYWVGSMDLPPDRGRGAGRLHRIAVGGDGGYTVTEHRSGIGVSNGTAFSPDGTTMYWADTMRDTVWAYDLDPDTGDRRDERVFLDFADLPGRPDGACVDADGCYWVACVFGSAVLRATPDGRVDRIVELPVERPTMPAFGGPALDTMYVTSIGGGDPSAADHELAGRLLALDVGCTGIAEPAFAG